MSSIKTNNDAIKWLQKNIEMLLEEQAELKSKLKPAPKEDTGKAYKGQEETGEWQLCPKCAGNGQIYRQDVYNDTTLLNTFLIPFKIIYDRTT